MSKIGPNQLSKPPDIKNNSGLYSQSRPLAAAGPRVLLKAGIRKSPCFQVTHQKSKSYAARNSNTKNNKSKTNNPKSASPVKSNTRDRSKTKEGTAGHKVAAITKSEKRVFDANSKNRFKSAPSASNPYFKQETIVTSCQTPTFFANSDDSRTCKGSTGVSSTQTSTGSMKRKLCLDLKVLYAEREKRFRKMQLELLDKQKNADFDSAVAQGNSNIMNKLPTNDASANFLKDDFHTTGLNVDTDDIREDNLAGKDGQDQLRDLQVFLMSLCERALSKKQGFFLWLQSLISNSSSSMRKEEFALKLDELIRESDELATSYSETMAQLNQGIVNALQLLQNTYWHRDLLKHNLLSEIAVLSQKNQELEKQLEATISERKALEQFDDKEKLMQVLTDERNQKHVLQEQLLVLDKQLRNKDDALKDVFKKFEKLSQDSTSMVEKICNVEEERKTMKQDYDTKLEMTSKSLEFNLEKIVTFRKYISELEETNTTQQQRLNALTEASNTVCELEAAKLDYEDKYMKSEIKLKAMEDHTQALEIQIEKFQHSLIQQTISKQEVESELLKSAVLLKSLQDKNQMQQLEIQQALDKALYEKNVATDIDEKLALKLSTYKTSLQERDTKIESYEDLFKKLHDMILQLKTSEVAEIDCSFMPELKEVILDQRMKLSEIIKQNSELSFCLSERDKLIYSYEQSMAEQASLLQMKDEVIQILTNKDEKQMDAIQFLHHNFEVAEKVENEIKRELQKRSEEFELQTSDLDTEHSEISFRYLENALKTQQQQKSVSRWKCDEKIADLERVLSEALNTDSAPQSVNFERLFPCTMRNTDRTILQLGTKTCIKTAPRALEHKHSADSMLINLLKGGKFRKFTP